VHIKLQDRAIMLPSLCAILVDIYMKCFSLRSGLKFRFEVTISCVCFSGQAKRICAGSETVNATWLDPDFSGCVSPEYNKLHREVSV